MATRATTRPRTTRFSVPSSAMAKSRKKRDRQSTFTSASEPLQFEVSVFFECGVCLDDCIGLPVYVAHNTICEECFEGGIQTQFEDAIGDENQYPVKWGETILKPFDYGYFFSHHFLVQYKEREYEYQTAIKARMYCKAISTRSREVCNAFLGRRKAGRSFELICASCGERACSKCAAVLDYPGLSRHVCEVEIGDDPFEGLTRGKDWQQCPRPTCEVKVALWDGCNHLKCRYCDADFCFLCGKVASEDSKHWMIGSKCPRFGRSGAANAIHDTDLAPDLAALQLREEQLRLEQQRIDRTPQGITTRMDRGELQILAQRMAGDPHNTQNLLLLVNDLSAAMEVHVAHLRDNVVTEYQNTNGVQARNSRIISGIRRASEEDNLDLFPSLRHIIARYVVAFEGSDFETRMAAMPEGRLRRLDFTTLRELSFSVKDILQVHSREGSPAPIWLRRVAELMELLIVGVDVYLYWALTGSRSFETGLLLHRYYHEKTMKLIGLLPGSYDDFHVVRLLRPVMESYELASQGRFKLRPFAEQRLAQKYGDGWREIERG